MDFNLKFHSKGCLGTVLHAIVLLGILGFCPCLAHADWVNSASWTYRNLKMLGHWDDDSYNLKYYNGIYYSINNYQLLSYDLKDPAHPVQTSNIDLPISGIGEISFYGNKAILGGADTTYPERYYIPELVLYDLSNPKTPVQIGERVENTDNKIIAKVAIGGSYAYLIYLNKANYLGEEIRKLDLKDPLNNDYSNIAYITPDVGNDFLDFAVVGNYGFALTNTGLLSMDVSTSASLERKAYLSINNPRPRAMVVSGNLAYVICGNDDKTDQDFLRIYDLSTPQAPVLVGQLATSGYMEEIAYSGGMVCLTYGFSNTIMRMIDVSDPSRPQILGDIQDPNGGLSYVSTKMYQGLIFVGNQILRYAPPQAVEVSGFNRPDYRADYLRPRNLLYTDRPYEYTAPLPFQGFKEQSYIQTRYNDKNSTGTSFLRFSIDRPATVYVAYDDRASAPPNWLASWVKKSLRLASDDRLSPGRILYARDFPAGEVVLGGNRDDAVPAPADLEMYGVLVVPKKAGVEDYLLYQ